MAILHVYMQLLKTRFLLKREIDSLHFTKWQLNSLIIIHDVKILLRKTFVLKQIFMKHGEGSFHPAVVFDINPMTVDSDAPPHLMKKFVWNEL